MKELTIILVSYNVKKFLKNCLDSIKRTTRSELFEIVVVDNNSYNGSAEMARRMFPKVKLIQSDTNLGFSGANNLALRQVRSKYILLLNPDTKILDNSIEEMLRYLKLDQNIGAVGPQIINPDGSLQRSCKKLPGFFDALFYISGIGRVFPETKIFRARLIPEFDYQKMQKVENISGACLMVKKEVFDDVGLLDERYFLYSEDVDLCMRMKISHWDIYYVPTAKVVHHGGQSSGYDTSWHEAKEMFKSWLKFRKKYFGFFYSFIFNISAEIILAMKLIYLLIFTRQRDKMKMYFDLLLWYWRNLI